MKKRILAEAKDDVPLYLNDFNEFWDVTLKNINDNNLYDLYKRTLVFKNWKEIFHSLNITNLDTIVNELFEDVNSSLYLAFLGQYRSAFMHMRSSIELSLQTLYFLHHPIEYSQWLNGNFLIKFNVLSDYLGKHPYLHKDRESNETLKTNDILKEIFKKWKHYSKHIHAESPLFFQCEKEVRRTNSFAIGDFEKWRKNYLSNIDLINKLYLIFFRGDINRFPQSSRVILESLLKENEKDILKIPID